MDSTRKFETRLPHPSWPFFSPRTPRGVVSKPCDLVLLEVERCECVRRMTLSVFELNARALRVCCGKECQECIEGTYSNASGAASCSQCEPGKYSWLRKATFCFDCWEGRRETVEVSDILPMPVGFDTNPPNPPPTGLTGA